jgi:hypothetical protein
MGQRPLYEAVFVPKGGNFCGLRREKVLPLMVAKTATLCQIEKALHMAPISKNIDK